MPHQPRFSCHRNWHRFCLATHIFSGLSPPQPHALPCSRCTCRVSSPPTFAYSRPPSCSPTVWCGCWLEGFSAIWEAKIHPRPPIFAHVRTPSRSYAGVTYINILRSHSLPPQPARPVTSAPTGVTSLHHGLFNCVRCNDDGHQGGGLVLCLSICDPSCYSPGRSSGRV
jgi:hypothetical protein